MIIDTDVLIWELRGSKKAREIIHGNIPFAISVVTYIELVQGMRNKQELQALQRTIKDYQWEVLLLDQTISHTAMNYVETFFHSHSLRLADALIAATAVQQGLTLLTSNSKHYQMIETLIIEVFHP